MSERGALARAMMRHGRQASSLNADRILTADTALEEVRRLRGESQRLLELRAYLNAVLKDKSCLIVGSAPGGTVPALHDSGPCICANGSIFTAQKFGISCPDMVVLSGYTTVRSEVGGILSWRRPETIEVLRGGRVKDLILQKPRSTRFAVSPRRPMSMN
jgi:hypothetical protein